MKKSPNTSPKSAGSKLPPLDKVEAVLTAEQNRRRNENKLRYYRPYAKQSAFHSAGLAHRERLFMAANQVGKTIAGGFEAAMHLTGRYPDNWKGRVFDQPTFAWAGSPTGETLRELFEQRLDARETESQ